jgi:hypothetical protein
MPLEGAQQSSVREVCNYAVLASAKDH